MLFLPCAPAELQKNVETAIHIERSSQCTNAACPQVPSTPSSKAPPLFAIFSQTSQPVDLAFNVENYMPFPELFSFKRAVTGADT